MPVDLETSLSFRELRIEMAMRVDAANEAGNLVKPGVPSDVFEDWKIKMALNRGYQQFLSAYPKWSFRRLPFQLVMSSDGTGPWNIDADAGRYRLPSYCCGQPVANWRYVDQDSGYEDVVVRPYEHVARVREMSSASTGIPHLAAVRVIESAGPMGRQPIGYEVLFHHKPDRNYVVEATFRTTAHRLVEDEDRTVAGSEHDEAILASAEEVWWHHYQEDETKYRRALERSGRLLAQSIELDGHAAARRRGCLIDTTRPTRDGRSRTTGNWSYNGQPLG